MLRERGLLLGVVTGKGAASAAISFRHLGLAPYFDVVEAGSPDGGVKPEAIRRVLARWDMPPGEAAYVGDSPSDMADAVTAGVVPLGAGWAATSAVQDPACCGARVTFESVERFCEWIESALRPGLGDQGNDDNGTCGGADPARGLRTGQGRRRL
jgi:phosphoglycolate phosphatase-like HAD superfamily hydrolase